MTLTPEMLAAAEKLWGPDWQARNADCVPFVVVTPAIHRSFLELPVVPNLFEAMRAWNAPGDPVANVRALFARTQRDIQLCTGRVVLARLAS